MNIGGRVGAIRNADKTTVYLFGYGTYQGKKIPPLGTIGAFGLDMGEMGMHNPIIQLDDGNTVWGCQCMYGSENKVKEMIGDRKVEYVKPPELYSEKKRDKKETLYRHKKPILLELR